MGRRRVLLMPVCLVVVAAAGCAGGSGAPAPPPATAATASVATPTAAAMAGPPERVRPAVVSPGAGAGAGTGTGTATATSAPPDAARRGAGHEKLSIRAVRLSTPLRRGSRCYGAGAIAAPAGRCLVVSAGALTETPSAAARDRSDAYGSVSGRRDCFARQYDYPMVVCHFGDRSAKVRVALVGNSHAAEWLPALRRVAQTEHWQITTYLASRCANALVPQDLGRPEETPNCLRWTRESTKAVVAGHFDLVVMADAVAADVVGPHQGTGFDAYVRGLREVLQEFATARLHVLVIRDSPVPGNPPIPACLAEHPSDYAACNGTRAQWLRPDPFAPAIARVGDTQISEADLTAYLCHQVVCPAVIGDIPVYLDDSHMTATYAATLAPDLRPYLVAALGGPPTPTRVVDTR